MTQQPTTTVAAQAYRCGTNLAALTVLAGRFDGERASHSQDIHNVFAALAIEKAEQSAEYDAAFSKAYCVAFDVFNTVATVDVASELLPTVTDFLCRELLPA